MERRMEAAWDGGEVEKRNGGEKLIAMELASGKLDHRLVNG